MSDISDLFEINKRLTMSFWHLKSEKGQPHELSPRLILPLYRKNEIRLCEQEAKILYCNVLNNLNYYYSIETPTQETYQQKGETPRGANSDISIFKHKSKDGKIIFEKCTNVEFKANKPKQENFRKDIEKLMREKLLGNWVHIVENLVNHWEGYINKIFDCFIQSFKQCKSNIYLQELNKNGEKVKEVSILFYFYSIKERWACMKYFNFDDFKYDNKEDDFENYVNNFFKINYEIKEKISDKTGEEYNYIDVPEKDRNGWYIMSLKDYHDDIYGR